MFSASGNRLNGYTFYAELPATTAQSDGFYYCKFRNKRGDLISNYVQVQNVYYYQKLMVDRGLEPARYLPTLNSSMFPMQLDCGSSSGSETLPDWADHSFPSPFRWSFCRFSEKDMEFQCVNRHSRAYLSATYRANPKSSRGNWKKDGVRLPSVFPTPTSYILTFPESIQSSFSGEYTLTVTDGPSRLEFRYEVNVVGPPEVIRPSPPLLLVMEGKTAEFECEIDVFQSRKINGRSVLFPASSKNRAALIEQFPYLKDVQIAPLDVQGSRLKYRASNLLFTPGSAFGSSHTVTIIGANSIWIRSGIHFRQWVTLSLQKDSTIQYFHLALLFHRSRPKVLDSPTRYHCVKPCLSSVEHVYDCQFDLTRYQMAHVEQTWDLNGLDVSKLLEDKDDRAEYLVTEGTKLKILPVENPTKAELFASSNLTCRLRIHNPTVKNDGRFGNAHAVVYDSRSDPHLQQLLTATASISWIAAVIIAIVVIIAIGALTACIVMHARGETYMLDREERALGNDPEKELREKESFRTYERAEEPPLRGSRCSLNDDSAEIGSDADGELDDYNLDPGKFNEEGSFIDQYATETHYKGASRLPTLPRA
ncbi:hypothetical protein FGIG_06800 [Fasciola gigantica]|uniref:Neurofascin/L1/NrCAM C-terminal domain-containing protein n=2 Tax=Echinostomatoidea TaxID=404429 RepID=A0A504YV96_FASGI|nr:hypothetical protein FGIG_06800 [Fasciola gigantica]